MHGIVPVRGAEQSRAEQTRQAAQHDGERQQLEHALVRRTSKVLAGHRGHDLERSTTPREQRELVSEPLAELSIPNWLPCWLSLFRQPKRCSTSHQACGQSKAAGLRVGRSVGFVVAAECRNWADMRHRRCALEGVELMLLSLPAHWSCQ